MEEGFRFGDAIGPAKLVYIHQPWAALKAIVAIDNVAAGPAIGGTRMALDVTAEDLHAAAPVAASGNSRSS